jgi:hypothetical protein
MAGGLPSALSLGLSDPSLNSAARLAVVGPASTYKYSPYSENLQQLAMPQETQYQYDPSADIGDVNFASQTPRAAEGGLVHLAEGGQPSYGNFDPLTSMKSLGTLGFEPAKTAQPKLLRVDQMGTPNYSPKILPQLAALLQSRGMKLAEGGQPDDHTHPNYDGTPVFRTGGLQGLGGKYVEGKGDGQSDDIPAMLADGEYVFDAQTVADFGNGSNKAGAKILDAMREAIRAHKRNSLAPC